MTTHEVLNDLPRQSIVLPVRNEGRFIAKTIDYIRHQEYPHDKLEIIVVDGISNDDTPDIVRKLAESDSRIRLYTNPRQLSSSARNIGARVATGDIITFIDGHVYIENVQLLLNIARLMKEKEVSILSRPQFLRTPENTPFQQAVAIARESFLGHGLDSTIYESHDKYVNPTSSGASYKKKVFEKIGYFDERFDAAEDWDFNMRVNEAGFRSFSSLKLAVYYYPRCNFRSLFRQMMRYGVGRFRIARKHHRYSSSGTGFPFLFVTGLPLLLLLSILHPAYTILLLGLYGGYAIINLASSIYVATSRGLRYLKYLPFIYLTIHWALGWGFAVEMIRALVRIYPRKFSILEKS